MNRVWILFVLFMLTACTAPALPPSPANPAPVLPTEPTLTPALEDSPAAHRSQTETSPKDYPAPQPALPTSTPEPSATPLPPVTTYQNEAWGLSFSYPAGWQAVQVDGEQHVVRYEGRDGFFELRGPFQGNHCWLYQRCRQGNPNHRDACSTGEPFITLENSLSIPLPGRAEWISLETTPEMLPLLQRDLLVNPLLPFTRTPAPVSQAWATDYLGDPGITIQEFWLGPAGENLAGSPCAPLYQGRVPGEDILSIHAEQRAMPDWDEEPAAPYAVELLPLFEYRLEGPTGGLYTLYQDDQQVKTDIQQVDYFITSPRQRYFALGITDQEGRSWLVRDTGMQPAPAGLAVAPVFAGQNLITAEYGPDGGWGQVIVRQDGFETLRYSVPAAGSQPPVQKLVSFDTHWALLVEGVLIVDGEIWNKTVFPADEIFTPYARMGKLFFFFIRDGLTGAWYDGEELPVRYDGISHSACCGYAGTDPDYNEEMVWFYALRDGTWYYVEMVWD